MASPQEVILATATYRRNLAMLTLGQKNWVKNLVFSQKDVSSKELYSVIKSGTVLAAQRAAIGVPAVTNAYLSALSPAYSPITANISVDATEVSNFAGWVIHTEFDRATKNGNPLDLSWIGDRIYQDVVLGDNLKLSRELTRRVSETDPAFLEEGKIIPVSTACDYCKVLAVRIDWLETAKFSGFHASCKCILVPVPLEMDPSSLNQPWHGEVEARFKEAEGNLRAKGGEFGSHRKIMQEYRKLK